MSLAEAKQENFQIALYNYIEGRYSLTAKCFAEDNNLDTTTLTEWVEFAWRYIISREVRHVAGKPGNINEAYMDVQINVKPTGNITRIARIKDTVIDLLRRPVIQVQDYVGGTTNDIGNLEGEGLVTDISLGKENDVNQHLLTFKFRYLERFDRYTT